MRVPNRRGAPRIIAAFDVKTRQSPGAAHEAIDNSPQERMDDQAVARLVRLDFGTGGRRMLFPPGRNLLAGITGVVVGGVFAGSGWFLVTQAGHPLMGAIFGLIGILIVVARLYLFLNSLEVRLEEMTVRTVRRILGIPVRRREMRQSDFVAFDKSSSMQSQSGGRHVMLYSVYAIDHAGERMLVGEGFCGAGQADAAIRLLGREFGLHPEPGFPAEPMMTETPSPAAAPASAARN